MRVEETTFYLEMGALMELSPASPPADDVVVRHAKIPCPELNRFFYTTVGADWHWIDRLEWTHNDWLAWVERPEVETWLLNLSGTPVGYFELDGISNGPIEIAYFGVLRSFTGRGLGGYLLTEAVRRAWAKGARRVWVHTSSLDHPAALANYLARGFRLYKQEVAEKDLPD